MQTVKPAANTKAIGWPYWLGLVAALVVTGWVALAGLFKRLRLTATLTELEAELKAAVSKTEEWRIKAVAAMSRPSA